jgi:spermidine synthase
MAEAKTFQFQFTEFWEAQTGLTFGIKGLLHQETSEFQKIQVLETDAFGRLLLLDGLVMLTDRDEFVYHEMITHPSLCLMEEPERVLVIGGGDGGTVREALRYASVREVDLVEIDGRVIDVCREFFPVVASALDDSRLTIHVADGAEFVRNAPADHYDLVTVDSTDPVGFAEALFGEDFYRECHRLLKPSGILAAQTESPFDRSFRESISDAHRMLGRIFPQVHMYLAHIPTYPTGTWSFTMGSKQWNPVTDFDAQRANRQLAPFLGYLQYYNTDIHAASFALPTFVKRLFVGV